MKWLARWWPALLWAVVISGFSTGAFTSEHTSHYIVPALHWIFPHASPEALEFMHHIIRKCAHLTEYFILSLLILRGIRAGRSGIQWKWALATILLVAAYASLDEFHQSFVPGRTPLVTDVMIDTSGGAIGLLAAAVFARRRQDRETGEQSAGV